MRDDSETPRLLLFRRTPADLVGKPPLASSLQSFESSLLLISLGRYPHALVTCAFAIESGIKAGLGLPAADRIRRKELLKAALAQKPQLLDSSSRQQLIDLFDTRDRIAHFGFGPKDDGLTSRLLLETGLPFLAKVHQEFFEFDLLDGLLGELRAQLENALLVFQGSKDRLPDPTRCFLVFGHQLRWTLKPSFMSDWEEDASEHADAQGLKHEVVRKQREEAEEDLSPAWVFDCPICGSAEVLVCQIEESDLADGRVTLVRAICVECGLWIPADVSRLVTTLCAPQVEEKRDDILCEYGY